MFRKLAREHLELLSTCWQQVNLHLPAIGDAGPPLDQPRFLATDQVLTVWEHLDKAKPGAVKGWTIEHAFVVREEQALGLNLSVQAHLYVAAPVLSNYRGHARAEDVTPGQDFHGPRLCTRRGPPIRGACRSTRSGRGITS